MTAHHACPTPAHAQTSTGLTKDPACEEQLRALWALTLTQRVAAMRAGRLSRHQLFAWAARHAGQVPLLNNEFEFIARSMADLDPD